MTLRPTPPAPITATRACAGTCAHATTAPTPVSTAQPSVASASNGMSRATGTAPASGTTTASAKHAVPRNGATSFPRAWSLVVPDGSLLRNVTFSRRSHSTARPSRQDGHSPHAGAQHRTTWSPALTRVTDGPTSRTMPAPSWPRMTGTFIGQSPRAGWRSLWHTPAARISTSTSPAPGASSVASSTDSGCPCSQRIAARMFMVRAVMLPSDVFRAQTPHARKPPVGVGRLPPDEFGDFRVRQDEEPLLRNSLHDVIGDLFGLDRGVEQELASTFSG